MARLDPSLRPASDGESRVAAAPEFSGCNQTPLASERGKGLSEIIARLYVEGGEPAA